MLDEAFAQNGAKPGVVVESNAIRILIAEALSGRAFQHHAIERAANILCRNWPPHLHHHPGTSSRRKHDPIEEGKTAAPPGRRMAIDRQY
jgi:hypothetical protein